MIYEVNIAFPIPPAPLYLCPLSSHWSNKGKLRGWYWSRKKTGLWFARELEMNPEDCVAKRIEKSGEQNIGETRTWQDRKERRGSEDRCHPRALHQSATGSLAAHHVRTSFQLTSSSPHPPIIGHMCHHPLLLLLLLVVVKREGGKEGGRSQVWQGDCWLEWLLGRPYQSKHLTLMQACSQMSKWLSAAETKRFLCS